jgi:subtilisin family serine protease
MTSAPTTDARWPSRPLRVFLALLALAVAASAFPLFAAAPVPPAAAQESGGEDVIVVLEDGADPVAAAREMGVDVTHIYRHVFTGFAGVMPAEAVGAAQRMRSVRRISLDAPVRAEEQIVPEGVRRAGVPHDPGDDHLDIDSPIDADIAILDTGVNARGELNVAGGKSCVDEKSKKKKKKNKKKDKKDKKDRKDRKGKQNRKGKKRKRGNSWEDGNGHGTHTAGIAAAIDNNDGVVGVAPGARIWAVKVLDNRGFGSMGTVICGLDWVVAKQETIDVVNLSLGGAGGEGSCNPQVSPFRAAICRVVLDAGIPVVVAAGNQEQDVAGQGNLIGRVPARYDEAITVSAYADFNGEPGGGAARACGSFEQDDQFALYSNFGADIDIAAPGECILSLANVGHPFVLSGTSEASPHVAGAIAHFVALYAEEHDGERPSVAQIRDWLLNDASAPQDSAFGFTGDPDTSPEPVLWLDEALADS